MTPDQAIKLLREHGAIPLLQGSLAYTKELRGLCLQAGLPAAVVRPPRRDGG